MFKSIVLFVLSFTTSLALANANQTPSPTGQNLAAQKEFIANMNQCATPKLFEKFILNALSNADNYQAKAKSAEKLEEVMLNNPACVISTVNKLDAKSCEQFKQTFIDETFFYPRDEIKSALVKSSNYQKSCLNS